METNLRESVKKYLHTSISEDIVNQLTGEILNTGIDEIEVFGNHMPNTSPLGFIDKNVELLNSIQDAMTIKSYALKDFYNNLINSIFNTEKDITADIEDFDVDFFSVSENIIENFTSMLSNNFIIEANEDIEKELLFSKENLITILHDSILKLTHFRDEYILDIKHIKVLSAEEKSVLTDIIKSFNNGLSCINDFIIFLNDVDTDYMFDINNKIHFIEQFKTIGTSLSILMLLCINIRLLFGNIEFNHYLNGHISLSGDLEQYQNNHITSVQSIFKIVKLDILDKHFKSSFSTDYSIYSLLHNANPHTKEILDILLSKGKIEQMKDMLPSLIAKQSSLSEKYVHHIDQLYKSLIISVENFNNILSTFVSLPLEKAINGEAYDLLIRNISSYIDNVNMLDNDITSITIGGAALASRKYKENL